MEEPCILYRRSIADSGKGRDMRKSNHCSKVKNFPSVKDALKKETKPKIEGIASPRSPMRLRKKLSIALSAGRFSNLSNEKTGKGYSPNTDSRYIQEFRVSHGRNVTNAAKENDMRKSNVWVKHRMKRKMVGNASPRSPMILRKKPFIATTPSRFRNSSNGKRENGYSRYNEDNVSYERRIPEFAEEKDMKKSVQQSHVKKSPSTKDVGVKDKMKLQTEGNASPSSSMILRKMRSTTIATRFRNLFSRRKENGYDSSRGIPSVGSSPHGDLGMNYTGKSTCLRCSNLRRKSSDSHRRFCSCSTEVEGELAASFEDSEGHQMKTSCSGETKQSDGSYDLGIECKQPGSLVHCGGKDCRAGYHSSCLDPSLNDDQNGMWLCLSYFQKKMEFGVFSISRGIESVLNSTDDIEDERHYFVKFKGLAPIHNCWISRSELLVNDPVQLAKFDKKWRRGQGSNRVAKCHDLSYKTSNLQL